MPNSNQITTIANAIQAGKKTVRVNGKTFTLPEPQKTGTSFQQRSYAEQKAVNLLG